MTNILIDCHLFRQLVMDESPNSYGISVRKNIDENGKYYR